MNIHRIPVNGITYRVFEWSPAAPGGASPSPGARPKPGATALLLHGFMDAGSTWDLVAPHLVEAGLRVLAPDLRGFGDSGRVGEGGYYHFPDYVLDIADLVDAAVAPSPLFLVGHSMGGTVASLFAGTFPDRVTKLALLEGIGPPDMPFELGPLRFRRWVEDVRALRARGDGARSIGSREDALGRLAANHPGVDVAILSDRLSHLVRDLPSGGVAWAHDLMHKTTSPMPFFAPMYLEFVKKVTAPTLFVGGGPLGFHPPDEDARLASFAKLTHRTIEGAGHMMHWTKPHELAAALTSFWAEASE